MINVEEIKIMDLVCISNEAVMAKVDNLTNKQRQIFYYVLAFTNPMKKDKEQLKLKDLKFSFNVSKLNKAFGTKKLDYKNIIQLIDGLSKKRIVYKNPEENNAKFTPIFSELSYDNGIIEGQINYSLLKYYNCFGPKNPFIKLQIKYTSKIKNKYGQLIYELIQMNDWKNNKQKHLWSLDFLKEKMNTPKTLLENRYFLPRVINKGIKDLERVTGWKISYKKIKKRTTITHLDFIVDKNPPKEEKEET